MPESSVEERDERPSRSQLFMLRLWWEDLGEGRTEWRGKIEHVATGEIKYFREWQILLAWLADRLPAPRSNGAPAGRSER